MRVLYVSQYFPPEIGAPAVRVHELSRRWIELGHEVTVLTGFPNHPTGVIHENYRGKFRRLFYREIIDGIDVVRTWLLPLPNRKSRERIFNYTSFFISACLRGMFLKRPDVIIGTSPQLLVGLAGWWLAKLKRVPVVFEVRDIWPDGIIASGVTSHESFLSRILRRIASFLHKACDHTVVVTPAFKDELTTKWAVVPERISVIQNGVETEVFRPSEDPRADKRTLGLEGRLVVSYIGTIGYAQGLATLLDAATILRTQLPDVIFLIVGEGADKEHLVARKEREGLTNFRILQQRPRKEIPIVLGASDVCVVLLKDDPVFATVIPTKMLEAMACARPLILGVDGQARAIVEEADAGIFVPPENAKMLADAVRRLHDDPPLCQRFGESGRSYVVERLSRKQSATQYMELLGRVTNRDRPRRHA